MDAAFEQKYHALEETHWWFRARRDCLLRLLTRLRLPHTANILDVGCSGGALAAQLHASHFPHVTGIDISPIAIQRCRERGLSDVHVMDAQSPALPPHSYDCIIASDILEHLHNPDVALQNWRHLLRSGATLLVFVPAFHFLWSEHDVVNHHFRRYTRPMLAQQLHAAGLTLHRAGYWNTTLFPPIAAVRLLQRLRSKRNPTTPAHDALRPLHPLMNRTLFNLLCIENRLLAAGLNSPLGVSTWTLAHSPS